MQNNKEKETKTSVVTLTVCKSVTYSTSKK